MDARPERVRAWVFFNATDAHKAAKAIAKDFGEGQDNWVIVRADVVEGDPNLVVPVDAASKEALEEVLVILRRAAGAEKSIARVKTHYPKAPHSAHCYVTHAEFDEHPDPAYGPPGRHPKSPGGNAWG